MIISTIPFASISLNDLFLFSPILIIVLVAVVGFAFDYMQERINSRPPKYTSDVDAMGIWSLHRVINHGNLWKQWKANEENRDSEIIFNPHSACEGSGVFNHYGGEYKVADGKITITMGGEPYLDITIKESEKSYATVTIVDAKGNVDEAIFRIYRG